MDTRQCKSKRSKLDEIHRNSYEIRTKFHISRKFTQIYSREIRTNFVRISYEFHVNFVQFANTQSKHTSKHTLQSHGQVMLHAPVLAHLWARVSAAGSGREARLAS